MQENRSALQDQFLNALRVQRVPVTLFLVNGFQQRGVVSSFDGFTLLLLSEGKQYLIYKHAISTIVPQTKVEPWGSQES
ncbi:RNA chaperone Hfq [Intestinimonas sp. MSJ-38]|uniref:RNA chaperone Hfq n=1 Tax=Intestinimonas sp. MSJ-38 TaxID=2841532 RepID=UPI000E4BCF73|nr:RNA chaperone Hfq [Intestinimonas sp. MSJ-38]MBU5432283.1 RNA chaperone Hfq [Intestinimonas sp. MSJ-38]RHT71942.1 RNA chaperone Hfq [Ruminococcaceae bacterium AM28-23LB]